MKCDLCGTEHAAHQAHVFPTQRNQAVTTKSAVCNQCVTKDEEIARLRNQLEGLMRERPKVKRDRAAYMRGYRARV